MKPDLVELVARWQAKLRLRDWRLRVEYAAHLTRRDGAPVHGLCVPNVDAKEACIQINDPATPHTASDPAVEETLVHELLHLHFAPLAENTAAGVAAEEQAVWAISEALTSRPPGEERVRFARVAVAQARAAAAPVRSQKGHNMNPLLLAALKAILASKDVEGALEAFVATLEGGDPNAAVVDGATVDQLGASSPMGHRAQVAALLAPWPGMPAEQRAFAMKLPPSKVHSFVGTFPERTRLLWEMPLVPRRTASDVDDDAMQAEVDRRMGVNRGGGPGPVQIDSRGRLTISALSPLRR